MTNEVTVTNGQHFKREGNSIIMTYPTEAESLQAFARMVKGFKALGMIKSE